VEKMINRFCSMRLLFCSLLLILLAASHCYAQFDVDFSVAPTACRNEIIHLENNSDLPGDVAWDFCASALDGTYSSTPYGNVVPFLTAIEIVEDNGTWYGFATSRSNELVRLNFGSNPQNSAYTMTSLGNVGGLLNSPDGISLMKENNIWYGLVVNLSSEIIRLKWTDLNSVPEAASLGLNATGKINQPTQIEIENENGEYVAVVINTGTNSMTMINFHGTLANDPVSGDMIQSDVFPGGVDMTGVTVTRQCTGWEIYAVGTDKIYRMSVNTLLTPITAAQMDEFSNEFPFSIGAFNRIKAIKYFDRTYFYFTSFTGGYIRAASWQVGAASPAMVDMGTAAAPSLPFSIALFQFAESYGLYVGGFNSGAVNAVKLVSVCGSDHKSGTDLNPRDVSYPAAGTYRIGLNVFYGNDVTCSKSQDLVILPADAPNFDVDFDNICLGSTTSFMVSSSETLTSMYHYGDGNADASGTHVYASGGDFESYVVVTAPNSCENRKYKDITIYEAPVAAFQSPTGLICTNNEFIFVNNTPDVFDGLLSYEWQVDNVAAGTERNLAFLFPSAGNKTVELTVSIPGCSDQVSEVLTGLLEGPEVGFSVTGKCEQDTYSFTNTSSGDIVGYQWTFGNGEASADVSPTIVYENFGTYTASLEVLASNGCVSIEETEVKVYSLPVPAFTLDLPPFSCSGTPSQFHDITPSPIDSNVQGWTWAFGDSGSGAGKDPTHTYTTAGIFDVVLEVATDKGCIASVQQSVSISPSPANQFVFGSACVNQPTNFNGQDAGVDGWQWKINNTNYNISNPVHVFISPGTYNVQLTKTGTNDCVTSITRQVVIPDVPEINFSTTNPCEGQETIFAHDVQSANDPVVGYSWTLPGGTVVNGGEASAVFAEPGTFPVVLSTITASGCAYSLTKNVSVFETPVAMFDATPAHGTPPLNVQFSNKSQNAQSYLWSFNDIGNSTSTEAQPVHIFDELGEYIVELQAISGNGCIDTHSQAVNVIIPYTEIELSSIDLVHDVTSGGWRILLEVTNNSNYAITSFDAVLDLGVGTRLSEKLTGDIVPGASETFVLSNQLLRAQTTGYVCIELVMGNDELLSNNVRCLPLGNNPTLFNPYPNPAKDFVNISLVAAEENEVEIVMLNGLGAEVYRKSVRVFEGLSVYTVDLSYFDTGIYIVIVRSGTVTSTSRILVE
jgi:PKD repeat protein